MNCDIRFRIIRIFRYDFVRTRFPSMIPTISSRLPSKNQEFWRVTWQTLRHQEREAQKSYPLLDITIAREHREMCIILPLTKTQVETRSVDELGI